MFCLDDTDVLEAWASVDAKIDCTIHGLVGAVFTNLYTGTLGNAANVVVYTAGEDVAVVSATFTNTHNAAVTVNFKLDPANGGNDKFLLPVAVSLEAGYGLVFDGQRFLVMNTSGMIVQSVAVSDAAYAAGWNGETSVAASKNAIYDKIELIAPVDGSWTPVLKFGGGVTGITYGTQSGIYTKIGNVVFFELFVILTSKGSDNGVATITGLPFPNNANQKMYYAQGDNISVLFQALLLAAGSSLALYSQATTAAALSDANFANNSNFKIVGSYGI